MNEESQSPFDDLARRTEATLSRRVAVGVSGLSLLGLLIRPVVGQERANTEARKEPTEESRQKVQEMMRQSREARQKERLEKMDPQERAFWEGIQNAGGMEERKKITQDWHIQRMQTNLNKELGVSPEEWAVIQPRLEAVLRLNQAPFGTGDTPVALLVAQAFSQLMGLVNKGAKPEEIKAKLSALRSTKEQARQELSKARQDLRKLMTIRQEAVLVLNGLLE